MPPVLALYHLYDDPDGDRSLTFLLSAEQKFCAEAAGAEGVAFTFTLTEVLGLSHPSAEVSLT